MGMRNIAKKRAPRFVVPVATAFPTAARSIRPMICRDRSWNRADVQVTQIDTSKVANCISEEIIISVGILNIGVRGFHWSNIPKQEP